MLQQIKTLTKLELRNLYGLNVFRHTKDPAVKRRSILLVCAWVLVIGVVFLYVGGLSYGLVWLGAGDVVPAYLMAISSLILFFFGIFKAGSVIFSRNGYDILCSLPVSQTAIVLSRFLRMYVEDLLLTLAVLLPGLSVYAFLLHPGLSFYLLGLLSAFLIPLAPIAAATLFGTLVTAISSRMKHKSLAEAALTVVFVLAVPAGSSQLAALEDTITPEMLQALSATVFALLKQLYPPAVWLGSSVVSGSLLPFLGCAGLFTLIFAGILAVVSANFHSVCRALNSTSAKHNYRIGTLKQDSVLFSLYKREVKRYFASSIYVSNTIIGPIMGTVLAGALLFVDLDAIPFPIDIPGLIPFALAAVFCLMSATSVSVSMEGKHLWIVKTLPLDTGTILDAKILMNLSLMLPFWLISEILLVIALKPGFLELVWLVVIPAVIMVFSCVYGITINLALPVLNWESETSVVKQSASALIGGFGGFLAALVCAAPAALLPEYADLVKAAVCLLLLGITAVLYRKNNTFDLKNI